MNAVRQVSNPADPIQSQAVQPDNCFFDPTRGVRVCPSTPGVVNPTAPATLQISANPQPTSVSNNDGGLQTVALTSTTPAASVVITKASQTPGPSSTPDLQSSGRNSSSNGGVSKGAVAGVAIGMLIVGAVLAFIAAFFVFKKRNRKQNDGVSRGKYSKYAESNPELLMIQQKHLSAGPETNSYFRVSEVPRSILSPLPIAAQYSAPSDVTSFLPPAASRDEIYQRMSSLFRQIHRHIETYYRDVHASITPSMGPELARFGAKGMNMAELLQDCSQPTTVLKHALVAYVLGITGPKNEQTGETLFPEELSNTRAPRGDTSISDPSLTKATNLHRRLAVYIYTSAHSTSNLRTSWSSQSDIREAAEHFSLTFFPWANPISSDQEKDEDLTSIILAALEVQTWLFGQPSEYELIWDGARERTVILNPGLIHRAEQYGSGDDLIIEATVAGV